MLKPIKRIALSFALLMYVSVEPQAHMPEIFLDGDQFQQTQSAALPAVNKPSNTIGNFSLSHEVDFRTSFAGKAKEGEVSKPASTQTRVAVKRDNKKNSSASSGSRFVNPTSLPRKKVPASSSSRVLLSAGMEKRLRILTWGYYERTGRRLYITSGFRTAEKQARAIQRNLRLYGNSYVLITYHRNAAIREIVNAYNRNRRKPEKAIREMTRVIQAQVRRGVYISSHMRGRAFDIRSRGRNGAKLSALREVAQSMGGHVSVERDHYHVQL